MKKLTMYVLLCFILMNLFSLSLAFGNKKEEISGFAKRDYTSEINTIESEDLANEISDSKENFIVSLFDTIMSGSFTNRYLDTGNISKAASKIYLLVRSQTRELVYLFFVINIMFGLYAMHRSGWNQREIIIQIARFALLLIFYIHYQRIFKIILDFVSLKTYEIIKFNVETGGWDGASQNASYLFGNLVGVFMKMKVGITSITYLASTLVTLVVGLMFLLGILVQQVLLVSRYYMLTIMLGAGHIALVLSFIPGLHKLFLTPLKKTVQIMMWAWGVALVNKIVYVNCYESMKNADFVTVVGDLVIPAFVFFVMMRGVPQLISSFGDINMAQGITQAGTGMGMAGAMAAKSEAGGALGAVLKGPMSVPLKAAQGIASKIGKNLGNYK